MTEVEKGRGISPQQLILVKKTICGICREILGKWKGVWDPFDHHPSKKRRGQNFISRSESSHAQGRGAVPQVRDFGRKSDSPGEGTPSNPVKPSDSFNLSTFKWRGG